MTHRQHPLRMALNTLAASTDSMRTHPARTLAVLGMLAAPLPCAASTAAPVPAGGTSISVDNVLSESMARNASGQTALVWYQADGLLNTSEIYLEELDATGSPITSAIPVTSNWYGSPAVAMDDDGDAVVTWVSGASPGSAYPPGSTNPATVYAQLFGPDGTPKGSPINVGPSSTSFGYATGSLSVTMDKDGDFVEAWTQSQSEYAFPYSVGYPFTGVHSVYTRAFSADGTPRSAVITVSAPQPGYNECSSVAMNSFGEFTVAWTFGSVPAYIYLSSGGIYTVQLQHYSAKGVAQGNPILATQFDNTALQSQLPMSCASIAMNRIGDFSLAWRDPNGNINLQKYKPRATTAPATTTVASYGQNAVEPPVAVIDSLSQPGVIWGELPDGMNMTVYGQWFLSNGKAMAPPFTLESNLPSFFSAFGVLNQSTFSAATDLKGDLGISWRNNSTSVNAALFKGL